MKFRPCIDIHNGRVKQIVGSTLDDNFGKSEAKDNFVSEKSAGFYGDLYKKEGLFGGHVIMLNSPQDEKYNETKKQARMALEAFPGGLQIGGGITTDNAKEWIEHNASGVIVTSFVFNNKTIHLDRLESLKKLIGANRIILDLSAKKVGGKYFVATDRWQNISDEEVNPKLFQRLNNYCHEYLIHAVDVEGKRSGIDESLVKMLGSISDRPITYAGGIGSLADIDLIKDWGNFNLDFTIGSALDLFGGDIPFDSVKGYK